MRKLVEKAVEAIRRLPPDTQDDLARFLIAFAEKTPEPLSADEAAAIAEGEAEIARAARP